MGSAPRQSYLYLALSLILLFLVISSLSPSSRPSSDDDDTTGTSWRDRLSPSHAKDLLSLGRTKAPATKSIFISTFAHDPQNLLAYRNHLELTTSPLSQITHSPTLTFDHIYVLSLPEREDRREEMNKLARALGLEFTFVDAVKKGEPWIRWIAERVVEVRKKKVPMMAKTRGVKPTSIGGLSVGNAWLQQTLDVAGQVPFPPYVDTRFPTGWVNHLEAAFASNTLDTLIPADPALNGTKALYDPLEKILGRQVNEGVISTYWGHRRAMKMIEENGDKSALILEDDVDFEWDLERMWSRIERKMSKDWEMAFLGHCWGRELLKPQHLHPLLHQSSSPLCLHAYALSSAGAAHVLSLLDNPWTAYQTAIDTAIPSFIFLSALNKSFSVDPPLVIQRKVGKSDIQEGTGSKWRGWLGDSTAERVWRDEGKESELVEEVYDPTGRGDPAGSFRYGKKCHD